MSTLAETATEVNELKQGPDMAFYRRQAQATKARRQAAGRYNRPSKAQDAAFKKSLARDGRKSLSIEELGLLATHPHLTSAQRGEFAAMAQSAVAEVVR